MEKGSFSFGSRRSGARKEGFLAGVRAKKHANVVSIFCYNIVFALLGANSRLFINGGR